MDTQPLPSSEHTNATVWSLLPFLGFAPDAGVFSDIEPGFSLKRRGLELTASQTVSRYFQPIILVGGYSRTERTLAQVHVELLPMVESLDQLKAILAHGIGRDFPDTPGLEWIAEGHEFRSLLPWEQARVAREAELAAFKARRMQRPHCIVGRPWMRLFMREVREELKRLSPLDGCLLFFDGACLVFRSPTLRVAAPATGPAPWDDPLSIPAGALESLPKRLMSDPVEVGIWEGRLEFGTTHVSIEVPAALPAPNAFVQRQS